MYENEFEKYDMVQFFKEYLREREKEVFYQMELDEAYERGFKIGLVSTLSEIMMEKYHEDAKDWLMDCSKKEIYEIYDLVGNDVPYESILEKYVKE